MNSDERRQAIELEIRNFGAAAARKDYLGVAGFFTEDAKAAAGCADRFGKEGDRGILARGTRAERPHIQDH